MIDESGSRHSASAEACSEPAHVPSVAWYALGGAPYRASNFEKTVEWLQKALELKTANRELLIALALARSAHCRDPFACSSAGRRLTEEQPSSAAAINVPEFRVLLRYDRRDQLKSQIHAEASPRGIAGLVADSGITEPHLGLVRNAFSRSCILNFLEISLQPSGIQPRNSHCLLEKVSAREG